MRVRRVAVMEAIHYYVVCGKKGREFINTGGEGRCIAQPRALETLARVAAHTQFGRGHTVNRLLFLILNF